ncbi:MAG: ATP-dependent Clp protease ATP-binding subunit [Candidatus Bipolaricaulis sp.]|nr:ATP-dependent Clp protease ATP-binding subunit [Candidatus Bipolaricaulis sp.]MDD2912694.1 ATP-dependent Clp protease ATP-binding subunit [Candidatus Bipolaricaulis anaerobius]HQM37352.1 ATP-dependent Clp protease ATP-binding subunit [Candidatus Bipolaricaulis anaerobius]
MSNTTKLCDLCRLRPATGRVEVVEGDRRRTLDICDHCYARLRRERMRSPLESFFEEFFPGAIRGGEDREAVDVQAYLSQHARDLLQEAAKVAVGFGKRELDTEHVLHALTESEVVREILQGFKLSADDVRGHVEHNAPRGDLRAEKGETVRIGITPRMKAVLEAAFLASRELGHSYVGPEHLLIGLVDEPDGLGGDILRRYGLTPEGVRRKTVEVVGQGKEEGRVERRSATPTLDKHGRDLTALARQGKLDPVIGRSKEIETVIEVLARRKKNNPVLIGEPGVGKTAIVEGLAQRIARDEVPEVLRGKRLVELSVTSLVAGTKYRGEFEERVKELLDEILAHQDELILFIDELHTIVGAGQAEGGMDISNSLKPALARGELHLIGATTLNEYQKHIEKDAALERRFQPVFIPEPTVEQTVHILRGLRDRFEAHHKVRITDEAIVAAAELADRYITGRYLPDKAIDLVDQAGARVRIASTSRPAEVQELEAEIKALKREQDYATSRKQFDRAKEIEATIRTKEAEREEATQKWKKSVASGTPEVRVEHVAEIVSSLTGIPVAELTAEEREKLLKLEEKLHERVVGQDEAVAAVSAAVRLSRAGLKEGHRPIATFLFLGPTGVGKTELAKTLAWAVFGDEEAMIRIDMSEYTERHTVSRLVGAPPGYVGYEEGGQLTERVRRRPYSVILLDEIEKAHPEVHNILLQVFDDGRLTDGKGRVVDFANTIIIATSNLGSDLIQRNLTAPASERLDYAALKERLMEVLRHHFRPEFLNRIDEVIVFHALTKDQIRDIVLLQLERVRRVAKGQGVELEFDPSLVDHLAEVGYRPEFGARELRRRVRLEVENALASALLEGKIAAGDKIRVTYDQGEARFEKVELAPDRAAP